MLLATLAATVSYSGTAAAQGSESSPSAQLEEVVVTARKQEESLQSAPLAISALDKDALEQLGIASLSDFTQAPSPFLRIVPYVGSGALPLIGMRGLSTDDPGQATNEPAVGVYVDGVYLGRAQGSAMELADVERIEVLRGPQGTLFGRNALGGAVSIISRAPTGELALDTSVDVSRYDALKAVIHLDLPAIGGLKTKLDAFKSERDGWVDNPAQGEWGFSQYDRWGARFTALWEAGETFSVQYTLDKSDDETALGYNQRIQQNSVPLPAEPQRADRSLTPQPLQPVRTETEGHALVATWAVADALTLKATSSYRELEYRSFENYPHIFVYFPLSAATAMSGLLVQQSDQQHQFSQELQATGGAGGAWGELQYAAGLYYFREAVKDRQVQGSTVFDTNTDPWSLLVPVAAFPGNNPLWIAQVEAKSQAAYAQLSWTPAAADRLEVTLGGRYTQDDKSGRQLVAFEQPSNLGFDFSASSFDHNLTLKYALTDSISAYVRNATAYRSGGVSLRDPQYVPYDKDEIDSYEIGLKSELWERRARFNVAAYRTDFDAMRMSFSDPANPTATRLFNASGTVRIEGIEAELTALLFDGLTVNASYGYLDYEVPPQVNPFNGAATPLELSQAPRHSGSLSVDYELPELPLGQLRLHADGYTTSKFIWVPQITDQGRGYTILNARVTLSRIPLFENAGEFRVALWGRNLADKEYYIWGMRDLTNPAAVADVQQFGEPRTYGIEFNYRL
jgi:iron complex outermembrane receptor protein